MKFRMMYGISFEKQLKKLDPSVQRMIAKYIKTHLDQSEDPRLKGKALIGDKKGFWRYRIGEYRLIVKIEDDQMILIALSIGHRKKYK